MRHPCSGLCYFLLVGTVVVSALLNDKELSRLQRFYAVLSVVRGTQLPEAFARSTLPGLSRASPEPLPALHSTFLKVVPVQLCGIENDFMQSL